ncbi:MAG: AbrB/MazE/SpoVT family DNA-binding domain-containing protein [Gammaproteobacteria bacterium]|nr:MAG: AbrB/MazE/SpoVT family DNA-binding domain-containing protein [Gammaproteobacteria bacterium]
MTPKVATLTVQKWGNSLAVRIPAAIARSAHFHLGTPVELAVQKDSILVRSTGEPHLTLDEMLDLFDPKKHSGEVMASGRIGKERF